MSPLHFTVHWHDWRCWLSQAAPSMRGWVSYASSLAPTVHLARTGPLAKCANFCRHTQQQPQAWQYHCV